MRARARRFWLFIVAGTILVSAVGLTLFAVSNQMEFYYDPADLAELNGTHIGKRARIGGFVEPGSLEHMEDGSIRFIVEDAEAKITVSYDGFIPDLFREGQGVICNGTFTDQYSFEASELLAKHDENYVPKELQDQMKEQGVYKAPDA